MAVKWWLGLDISYGPVALWATMQAPIRVELGLLFLYGGMCQLQWRRNDFRIGGANFLI